MKTQKSRDLVLAVTLNTRGFAFVLLEGPEAPFDWAIVTTSANARGHKAMQRIEKIIDLYQPTSLVLEAINGPGSRHSEPLKRLSRQLAHLGSMKGLAVKTFDRANIRQAFQSVGAKTKPEIANAIALAIPAFDHALPPQRKLWMSEDRRQLLFDAAALGITFFAEIR